MSVLCVQIPGFLLQLAYQADLGLQDRPLALLDAHAHICAANAHAYQAGVRLHMRGQQALACCPELTLLPADLDQALAQQAELLATLTAVGLPTEEHGWGRAYLDLRGAAHNPDQVQATAAALGQTVRRTLGASLAPALGWDSSKFTARAAATYTAPGRMKLIAKSDEPHFLAPLSTRLLPLSRLSLQELTWLGIQTLGQFAHLPVQAVVQRYGPAGRIAHRWARGLDDRPVRPTAMLPTGSLTCEFDPPVDDLETVLAALHARLRPHLATLERNLSGIRSLTLRLTFFGGAVRSLPLRFVEPVAAPARIQQHLRAQLQALHWPQALAEVELQRLETGELAPEQPTLFALDESGRELTAVSLPELAQRFAARYGAVFRQARLTDPNHPLAERRFVLDPALCEANVCPG